MGARSHKKRIRIKEKEGDPTLRKLWERGVRTLEEKNWIAERCHKLLQKGNLNAAEQLLEEYKKYKTFPQFLMLRADLQHKQGNITDAIKTLMPFLDFCDLDPKYHSGVLMLGHLYQEKGESAGAEYCYRMVLQQCDPGNRDARTSLDKLLRRTGQSTYSNVICPVRTAVRMPERTP